MDFIKDQPNPYWTPGFVKSTTCKVGLDQVIGRKIYIDKGQSDKDKGNNFGLALVTNINTETNSLTVEWRTKSKLLKMRNIGMEEFKYLNPEMIRLFHMEENNTLSSNKDDSVSLSKPQQESSWRSAKTNGDFFKYRLVGQATGIPPPRALETNKQDDCVKQHFESEEQEEEVNTHEMPLKVITEKDQFLDLVESDFCPENSKQIVSFSDEVIGCNIVMKRNDGSFSSAWVIGINVEAKVLSVEWRSRKGSKREKNLKFEEQGTVFEFLSPEMVKFFQSRGQNILSSTVRMGATFMFHNPEMMQFFPSELKNFLSANKAWSQSKVSSESSSDSSSESSCESSSESSCESSSESKAVKHIALSESSYESSNESSSKSSSESSSESKAMRYIALSESSSESSSEFLTKSSSESKKTDPRNIKMDREIVMNITAQANVAIDKIKQEEDTKDFGNEDCSQIELSSVFNQLDLIEGTNPENLKNDNDIIVDIAACTEHKVTTEVCTIKNEEGTKDFGNEFKIPFEASSESKQFDHVEGTDPENYDKEIVVDIETSSEGPNAVDSSVEIIDKEDVFYDDQSNVSRSSKKGNRVLEHLRKLFVSKEFKKS